VSARGTVALNRAKVRRLLREVERRVERSAAAAAGSPAERGRLVCSVVNQALAPRPGPLRQASAALLRRAVTDRGQLAQIDYWLARMAVRAVTGDASVQTFRRIPYRTIREEWGLVSLEHARNEAA
jgi:hypothetical protein